MRKQGGRRTFPGVTSGLRHKSVISKHQWRMTAEYATWRSPCAARGAESLNTVQQEIHPHDRVINEPRVQYTGKPSCAARGAALYKYRATGICSSFRLFNHQTGACSMLPLQRLALAWCLWLWAQWSTLGSDPHPERGEGSRHDH